MGYMHIANLYRPEAQTILLFRECYAMEKLHGTSSHVAWKDGSLRFFAGGENHERFMGLFDHAALTEKFTALGKNVTVYGEAYGGKQQGQSWRYGKELRFTAFDVRIDDTYWLAVPQAADVCKTLGIEFVHYVKIPTTMEAIDAERDAPSEQARRNGVEGDQPREGVVLRPLIELTQNNDQRIIAKHKRDEERETRTPRKVVDPAQLEVLTKAQAIADEWVTPTRLAHVLDKLPQGIGMEATPDVIRAMVEDVLREAAGEIVDSKEARREIGTRAAKLFKRHLNAALRSAAE